MVRVIDFIIVVISDTLALIPVALTVPIFSLASQILLKWSLVNADFLKHWNSLELCNKSACNKEQQRIQRFPHVSV